MMKKVLLASALMCAIVGVAASAATASAPLLVTGAGFSTDSCQVVVHARGTGPTPQAAFETTPAVGFLRAPDVFTFPGTANLSGTVTCIGTQTTNRIAVSGTLDTPFVSPNGFTFPDFTMLIIDEFGPGSTPWIGSPLASSALGEGLARAGWSASSSMAYQTLFCCPNST